MPTSFHHQPEAQHPNFQLSTSWQADYPIFRGVKRTTREWTLAARPRAQLALHGEASIDGDRRARHEIRGSARQKNRDPGEILRITPTARGRPREHALVEAVHLAPGLARQIGIDPARQHRIDLDVLLRPGGR